MMKLKLEKCLLDVKNLFIGFGGSSAYQLSVPYSHEQNELFVHYVINSWIYVEQRVVPTLDTLHY